MRLHPDTRDRSNKSYSPLLASPSRLLDCAFWSLPLLFVLLHLFPPLPDVTKRRKSVNMCISANNSWKPQKAHSKTESRPTSVDQQHKDRSTRTRPQAAGNNKKHTTRTGAVETKQHSAPNSPECNRMKRTRLHPDTRETSNNSTAPTATPEAPGKPRRLKCYLAPSPCLFVTLSTESNFTIYVL